jgi:hypothetical protein
MTAANKFHMPGLLDAETAAYRIIRAIRAGTKVYNFPWHVHLMVKLTRWLPDRVINWVMSDYNEDAKKSASQQPPVP